MIQTYKAIEIKRQGPFNTGSNEKDRPTPNF